jgi:rubrerythrin
MPRFSTNEVIEMAVQIERSGYAFYNEALNNKAIKDSTHKLLTLLRDQEVKHEKFFLSLRDEKDLLNLEESQDWDMISSYIKMITDSRLFSDEKSAIKLATNAKSDLEIIDYAITFEKDTLLFFHTLKDKIENDKTRMIVQEIIQEEITHVFRLTEYKSNQLNA